MSTFLIIVRSTGGNTPQKSSLSIPQMPEYLIGPCQFLPALGAVIMLLVVHWSLLYQSANDPFSLFRLLHSAKTKRSYV
jgi:hypothetical protein